MTFVSRLLVVVLLVVASASARAEWRTLDGRPAPDFHADTWLNTDGTKPTVASLRGKVWVLGFFASWCDVCMRKAPELESLRKKFEERGLRIVAISDESSETLKSKLVDGRGVGYWIGSDPEDRTQKRYARGEVAIPQFYLIDSTGTVVREGIPGDDEIEKLLANTFDPALRPGLHASLAGATKSYEGGHWGEARRLAAQAAQGAEAQLVADARYLQEKAVQAAQHRQRQLDTRMASGRLHLVFADFVRLAVDADGMEPGTWAAERLERITSRATMRRDEAAWTALRNAVELDVRARTDAERKAARAALAQVRQEFRETPVAEVAELELERS